jgi:hypothetical protein
MVIISAWFNIDIQTLLRVPIIKMRLIDLVIFINATLTIIIYLRRGWSSEHDGLGLLKFFIIIYVVLEIIQLFRTWGQIDSQSQLGWFAATLSILTVFNLCIMTIDSSVQKVMVLLSLFGGIVLIFTVLAQLIGLAAGFAIKGSYDRVNFIIPQSKETISNFVLIATVLVYGFSAHQLNIPFWKKTIYYISIAFLLLGLVMAFHRGLFILWVLVVLFFILRGKSFSIPAFFRRVIIIIVIFYTTILVFGNTLRSLGYDPLNKIANTAAFTLDIDNPDWDKGRFIAQSYAIKEWLAHPWLGVGYSSLERYVKYVKSTPHNFIITSLFHRGIIGTGILTIILIICYYKSFRLLRLSGNLSSDEKTLNYAVIFTSWLGLIPLLTQEMIWERYSLSIHWITLGVVVALSKYYQQKQKQNKIDAQTD